MARAIAFSLGLLLLPWAGFCHEQQGDNNKNDEPIRSELRFMDDSVVRVFLLPEQLEVVTRFGKLHVPVSEIQRIEFGVRCPIGLEPRIGQAIEDLGSEVYKTREAALRNLIEWGPYAYPRLYRVSKSNQPEVAKRVGMALEKIRAKHPARNLRLREDDVIVTSYFTMVGRRIIGIAFAALGDHNRRDRTDDRGGQIWQRCQCVAGHRLRGRGHQAGNHGDRDGGPVAAGAGVYVSGIGLSAGRPHGPASGGAIARQSG
jgi:hypothetical protein